MKMKRQKALHIKKLRKQFDRDSETCETLIDVIKLFDLLELIVELKWIAKNIDYSEQDQVYLQIANHDDWVYFRLYEPVIRGSNNADTLRYDMQIKMPMQDVIKELNSQDMVLVEDLDGFCVYHY